MPLLTKKPKAVPQVNAAEAKKMREVTLELPEFKKLTQAQIDQIEEEEGKEMVAICDVSGEPIFLKENANVIKSDRPELDGKVICTRVLKKFLEINGEKLNLAKVSKSKSK